MIVHGNWLEAKHLYPNAIMVIRGREAGAQGAPVKRKSILIGLEPGGVSVPRRLKLSQTGGRADQSISAKRA